MSILIIDDNKADRELLSAILSVTYTTYCANSGISGIELAQQLIPEVIVLDIHSDTLDGFSVLESLKKHTHTGKIPIIYLSPACIETSYMVKGLKLGAFDCLAMPIEDALLSIKVDAAIQARRKDLVLQQSKVRAQAGKVDILVIDDAPDMILLLEEALTEAGYKVKTATTGSQGLIMAQELRPQLILLDVLMPGLNGFDTCRRLKGMPGTEFIPVVFVTSENINSAEEEGFNVGGVDYITKPINIPLLIARVKIHMQLKLYQDSLEDIVKQRTKALRTSLGKLSNSNQIKDEFLTIINHELRTPLNGALGALYLIQNSDQSPKEQVELIDTASHSLDDLVALVENILLLTEAIAGTLKIEKKPYSLSEVLKSVSSTAQKKAEDKSLAFEMKVDTHLYDDFIGDSANVIRVMAHLLDNAVKFTHSGKVCFTAKLEKIPNDEGSMCLKVNITDTGIGISADKLQLIFQLFKQLESDAARRFGGMGVGLSLVQSLLILMKGTIRLNSEDDIGTSVDITIPLAVGLHVESEARKTYSRANAASKTMLIVEDNPVNLIVERKFAEKYGVKVLTAMNGEEALVQLENHEVDIILMDCQMPVMDGFEATKIIRKSTSNIRTIPIIAVTANSTALDRELCLVSGMNDYVPKPIDFDVLNSKLDHWLSM